MTFEVDFKNTAPAHMCTLIPGVERTGPRTITLTHDDYVTAYKTFLACAFLGLHMAEGKL